MRTQEKQTDPNAQVQMIGLGEAAARLHIPYQDAHRLLLTGKLAQWRPSSPRVKDYPT